MYNKQIAEVFASLINRLLQDKIYYEFKKEQQLDYPNKVLRIRIMEQRVPSIKNIENIRQKLFFPNKDGSKQVILILEQIKTTCLLSINNPHIFKDQKKMKQIMTTTINQIEQIIQLYFEHINEKIVQKVKGPKGNQFYQKLCLSGIKDITIEILKKQDINDFDLLNQLTNEDLKGCGITLGQIAQLRSIKS